jgi:hypothetical protein
MSHDLDHLLAQLSSGGAAAPAGLEGSVLATIAGRREDARRARTLAPVRLALVGMASAIGVAAGGLGAAAAVAEPQPAGPFSAHSNLAPSTLLEGGG